MDRFVRGIPWQWAALVVALATTGEAYAQQSAPPVDVTKPQAAVVESTLEQVVVLRDGGVLSGRVTRSGDRYVLARGTGEMLIPASNVMLVAASLEDAYQQRRQRSSRTSAEEHLALAEWCLRCELMAHAERELAEARALDARNDNLILLERRLALANERREKQADAPAPSKPEPAELLTEQSQTAVSDLPVGAVERFTRKVQPVLVNSCTTTGCHQPGGAEKFQLDRAILRGLSNRRSTMNNLAATLALVDREQPQLSPLLSVPRRTHGGMKRPVFGPRQEAAFRHLVEWVELVAGKSTTPAPATAPPAAEGVELVAAKGERASRWASPVMRVERPNAGDSEQAVYQESAEPDVSIGDETAQRDVDAGKVIASPLRYGARLQRWSPRDPFDPEIFNRQYGPRSSASTNESAIRSVENANASSDEPAAR